MILALAQKDLKLLLRDRMGFIWLLGVPLMFAFFFGAIFGSPSSDRGRISMVVIDQDQSKASKGLVERLADSSAMRIYQQFENDEGVKEAYSLDQGKNLVRTGKRTALLLIEPGFGTAGNWAESPNGPMPDAEKLHLGIDPSRKASAGILEGLLMQSLFEGLTDQFQDTGAMRDQIQDALQTLPENEDMDAEQRTVLTNLFNSLDDVYLQMETEQNSQSGSNAEASGNGFALPSPQRMDLTRESNRPRSAYEVSFPQAMLWALLGVVSSFSISLVKEKTQGTMERLLVSPVQTWQILLGKGLACFLACLGVLALITVVGMIFFGLRLQQPMHYLLAVLACSWAFTALMTLFSLLGQTERAVSGASWAIFMVMSMLGGGMVPLIAMPQWMLDLSQASPAKWAILSLEGAIWRGFDWSEMALPISVLMVIGLLSFAVASWVHQRQ